MDTIPKGTRFGPLIGRHSNADVISLTMAMKLKHVWLVRCFLCVAISIYSLFLFHFFETH